ncbi:MAG TPA: T9SS type A sorting domain-containing protein, partial [bacterium]|nr:T9SS type A sorting domain-containing protein [bacterium]
LNAGNMTGIHIIGLPANAKIEIYDILGQLVDECEPLTNQGMVIWDAYNKKGEKVASGVYLVVIESPLGKKVKKLAIIR